MRIATCLLFPVVLTALCAVSAQSCRGDMIELVNGSILQGDIVSGQTTDEGLAVKVYDTDGILIVKWDHIVESRRRQLRLENGIDLPEETVELVDGHRVLLNSGEYITGIAENPRDSAPLRMKTLTGTKEYDRSLLAGKVEDVKIDGLLVFNVEDLYQHIRDQNPPETAAAHKAMAQRCMNIGAYEHAKEHLLAASADEAFKGTAEGRAIDAMLRQAELMIRAKGASDLVQQIKRAQSGQKWNDALKLLNQIDAEYKDEQIRKAISFDLLEARVVKGRDTYFQRQIALDAYKVLESLTEKKAREQKPLRPDAATAAPTGAAAQGSLAAARQWANRELSAQLWEKVGQDLGLTKEELEKYWKDRSVKNVRRVSYGTGSFIVVKKAAAAGGKPGGSEPPRRRPPGSDKDKGGKNVPDKPQTVEKPLTDEQWWETRNNSDRRNWLIAYYVETSGYFDIVRADEPNCEQCGGTGKITSTGTDGNQSSTFCKICNEAGRFRFVSYR
jgi:hypothetical protein